MLLKDKVAIVTGGGQGIGEGIVNCFAREGAKIVVVTRSEKSSRPVADRVNANGGTAVWFAADVTKPEDVTAMVDFAVKTYGRLDIACNNAGRLGNPRNVAELPAEELDEVMDLDLRGTFLCCREEIQAMRKTGGGAIVNISSVSGLHGNVGLSSYNMAKHAVLGLTRAAALEEIANNIRINAVCPGAIMTPLQEEFKKNDPIGFEETLRKSNIPVGRMGTPEEVGNVVAFLCSDMASYMVGSAVVVDGGVMAQ